MGVSHTPVLLDEVINNVASPGQKLFVDATIGGGGHAYFVLEKHPNLTLIGMDADEEALHLAEERLAPFGDRVRLKRGNFRELKRILTEERIFAVDAILFDLGISMYQIAGDRGFSFGDESELDMRMDRGQGRTAFDVVNRYSFRDLTRVIKEYGEEIDAEKVARGIVEARKRVQIRTGRHLADVVAGVKRRSGRMHPATKTFQAIRIEVNEELESLKEGLTDAIDMLAPGGRVGVISFHSLEDRIVKNLFKASPLLTLVTKKPIRPGRPELRANRRSRSAKLRVAEKLR